MTVVQLADGSSVESGCAPQTIYNAALRGVEARALDSDGRVTFATADLPTLTLDGLPAPFWIRCHFNEPKDYE